ncbi:uncharacterized protein At5g43822 isoform X3 [Primulina huaijiensis]|uniref:uncharacterized protein At5g43822 isoform X3 n=1 Tax=Primulina huaijiensis TaxID=1492673 RepID=UPI003CC7846F
MDSIIKKYQQKFRKVKAELSRWDELQTRLTSQFSNAASIIQRLQVIQDPGNYGILKCVEGIEDAVLGKQMESLQSILLSMNTTLYLLKLSVVSALPALALKPSASADLGALQQLLVDQPNIHQEEGQYIYDIIFAEEIS